MNDINDEIKYKKLRKKIFAERDAWRDRIVRDAIRIAFNQAIEAGDIDENTPREEALKIQANYIRRNLEAGCKTGRTFAAAQGHDSSHQWAACGFTGEKGSERPLRRFGRSGTL